jgi:outer membrane lipoprotein-sorting protein
MASRSLIALLALLVLLAGPPPASLAAAEEVPPELASFLAEIQAAADTVTAFAADFRQERHLALFAEPVLFLGRLTVVRPDRLRWEFTAPIASVLVLAGEGGLRCDDSGTARPFSLAADPVMRAVADQLWLWLGGDYRRLAESYRLQRRGEDTLLVEPREEAVAAYLAEVAITFSRGRRQPEEVVISEPGGDLTRISFSALRLNPEIPPQLFTGCAR